MEELKKYKWLIITVLPISLFFIIYNNFIKKDESDMNQNVYNQQTQAVRRNPPAPSQPRTVARPATPGANVNRNRQNGANSEKFSGYEEIVKEIYGDFQSKEYVEADIKNYFLDFKLSSDMQKKAKDSLSSAVGKLSGLDIKRSKSVMVAESNNMANEYIKSANKAVDNKNYLKAEIFAKKAMVEIEKIERILENEEKGREIDVDQGDKAPQITNLYKGFIMFSNKKVALIRHTKTYPDIGAKGESRFLKLTINDELTLSDGNVYTIMNISVKEVKLVQKNNDEIIRYIPLDKSI